MNLIDRDRLIKDLNGLCAKRDTLVSCERCNKFCVTYDVILGQPRVEVVKEGEKEMDYTTLKIEFKDGSEATYTENHNWEDWDMVNGFVVVKDKDGKWVGMHNTDCIKSVMMY